MHWNSNRQHLALKSPKKHWIGKRPGRTLQRIGTALAGFWFASNLLRIFWPEADQISTKSYLYSQIKKTRLPNQNISLLIIGEENKDESNNNQNPIKRNLNTIKIIIINKETSTKIIKVPIDLPVQITNQRPPLRLIAAYRLGGISLTYDLISNILGIPLETPRRYIHGKDKFINKFIKTINPGGKEIDEKSIGNRILSEQIITKFNLGTFKPENYKYKLTEYSNDRIERKNREDYISMYNNLNLNNFTRTLMKNLKTNLKYKEFKSMNSLLIDKSNLKEIRNYTLNVYK